MSRNQDRSDWVQFVAAMVAGNNADPTAGNLKDEYLVREADRYLALTKQHWPEPERADQLGNEPVRLADMPVAGLGNEQADCQLPRVEGLRGLETIFGTVVRLDHAERMIAAARREADELRKEVEYLRKWQMPVKNAAPPAELEPSDVAAKVLSEDTLRRLDAMSRDEGETVTVFEFEVECEGDETVTVMEFDAVRAAALALYEAGVWSSPNVPADHAAAMWANLRDALGLEQGHATERGVGAESREPEVSSREGVKSEPDPGEGYRWVRPRSPGSPGETLRHDDECKPDRMWVRTNAVGDECLTGHFYRRRIDAEPQPSSDTGQLPVETTPRADEMHNSDITARLRVALTSALTRSNMIGTDDEDHYWDCQEAAEEIVRLRRKTRLTAITDEERKMIDEMINDFQQSAEFNEERCWPARAKRARKLADMLIDLRDHTKARHE